MCVFENKMAKSMARDVLTVSPELSPNEVRPISAL